MDSHIIHNEPIPGGPSNDLQFTVTFSSPIIALIYQNTKLDYSDASLGNATTAYPFGVANRGFSTAFSSLDTVRLTSPYTVSLTIGAAIDQIRVLTVATPAPGPGATLALGGLVALRRRRRA